MIPLKKKSPDENKTGLPDNLKAGVEQLSGHSLNDVKVHYNSAQPAQLNALAYAQGTDIHVAPGQEKHLPHEAWHVAQQKQGRVQPTTQTKGVPVNDDKGLESEADTMGAKAVQMFSDKRVSQLKTAFISSTNTFQFVAITSKLRKAIETWAGTNAEYAIDWLKNAPNLTAEDVKTAIASGSFKPYKDIMDALVSEDATSETFHPVAEEAVELTPHETVKRKIKAARLNPASFSDAYLDAIWTAKNTMSWDEAIRSINTQRLARIEAARLVVARTAKYSGAKAAGDLIFAAGLIREVWDYSYAIAISGTAGPNTTLATPQSDADINAAAAIWHGIAAGPIQAPALRRPRVAESVTNFHVPGAPAYIEDKSTRERNPDPTRGRQADFICRWGAVDINIHVDSTTKH